MPGYGSGTGKADIFMEENKNTNADAQSGDGVNATTTNGDEGTEKVVTMSQADFDKAIQSAEDRVRGKMSKTIKELQEKVKELTPVEKTQDQIDLENRIAALEQSEREVADQKRKLDMQEQLAGMGITRPTHVVVQAGVGALAASVVGFYSALFPENPPIFIVVEPDKAPCVFESIKANDGKCHSVKGDLDTIMAGLACGDPSPIAFNVLSHSADFFLSVPDYIAARGMRILSCPLHGDPFVISGESGAVPLGALYSIMTDKGAAELRKKMKLDEYSLVYMVNTEGNTDPKHFRQIIWDGRDPVPREFRTRR